MKHFSLLKGKKIQEVKRSVFMNICAERTEKAEQNEPVCYLGSGVKHF